LTVTGIVVLALHPLLSITVSVTLKSPAEKLYDGFASVESIIPSLLKSHSYEVIVDFPEESEASKLINFPVHKGALFILITGTGKSMGTTFTENLLYKFVSLSLTVSV